MKASWVRLGRIAFPAIVTTGPIAVGVLTGMVATHGADALAAWGIGARIDAIFTAAFCTVGSGHPFVGQNFGAHGARVRVPEVMRFVVGWGAIVSVHYDFAPWLAAIFSDPGVQTPCDYLRIVPTATFIGAVGFALQPSMLWTAPLVQRCCQCFGV